MTMPDHVRAFLDEQPVGVLATTRADGTPRQSLVYHLVDGDRVLVSTESKRAKARDVVRTGKASYCVMGHLPPYPAVTVEGPARIVTAGAGEATGKIFARITGKEPDEPLTDEAVAQMDRVILELTVDHVYGLSYIPEPPA
jgi:PPOX class probable F420-dependent enzyme